MMSVTTPVLPETVISKVMRSKAQTFCSEISIANQVSIGWPKFTVHGAVSIGNRRPFVHNVDESET